MGRIKDRIVYLFMGGWIIDLFKAFVKIENNKVKK